MKETINTFASEKVVIKDLVISGTKDYGKNGKINYKTPVLEVSNVSVAPGSTVYNCFEGSQITSSTDFLNKTITLTNVTVDNPSTTHNILNVYTPADNAVITIKDSTFNLNVKTSNAMRISNYANSSNVTVVFDNVEWTYENATATDDDFKWGGLLLYQAVRNKDHAYTGGLEEMLTWTFKFKNCKYNGTKVTANNFGEHNQVFYAYGINGGSIAVDPEELGFNIIFE